MILTCVSKANWANCHGNIKQRVLSDKPIADKRVGRRELQCDMIKSDTIIH